MHATTPPSALAGRWRRAARLASSRSWIGTIPLGSELTEAFVTGVAMPLSPTELEAVTSTLPGVGTGSPEAEDDAADSLASAWCSVSPTWSVAVGVDLPG